MGYNKRHEENIEIKRREDKVSAFTFLKDFAGYDNLQIKVLNTLSGDILLKTVEEDLVLSDKKINIIESIAIDLSLDIQSIFKDKEEEIKLAIYNAEQQLYSNNVIPPGELWLEDDITSIVGVEYVNDYTDFKKEIIECIDYMIEQVKRDLKFIPKAMIVEEGKNT